MLVQGAAVGHVIEAPTLVEEGIPCHGFPTVIMEQAEDLYVPQAQFDGRCTPLCAKFQGKDLEVTHDERLFSRASDASCV